MQADNKKQIIQKLTTQSCEVNDNMQPVNFLETHPIRADQICPGGVRLKDISAVYRRNLVDRNRTVWDIYLRGGMNVLILDDHCPLPAALREMYPDPDSE